MGRHARVVLAGGSDLVAFETNLRRLAGGGLDFGLLPIAPSQGILRSHLLLRLERSNRSASISDVLLEAGAESFEFIDDLEAAVLFGRRVEVAAPIPNDGTLLAESKWHLKAAKADGVSAKLVQQQSLHSTPVRLGHIDYGFTPHPVLGARGEWFTLSQDTEFDNSTLPARDLGHGTRVGALASGFLEVDGNVVFSGVAPNFQHIAIGLDRRSDRLQAELATAIRQLVARGVDVLLIGLELRRGGLGHPLSGALRSARSRGVIVVCGAGDGADQVQALAKSRSTIAVAATTAEGYLWRGSSFGSNVAVAAPGAGLVVPARDGDGYEADGSSTAYAAAIAAGAACLWLRRWSAEIQAKYGRTHLRVDAFRAALASSGTYFPNLEEPSCPQLNVEKLLDAEYALPEIEDLNRSFAAQGPFDGMLSESVSLEAAPAADAHLAPEMDLEYQVASRVAAVSEPDRQVNMLFATNRRGDGYEFTGERGDDLRYGMAAVSVPENHRMGRLEQPRKLQLFSITLWESALDPREHFVVRAVEPLTEEGWRKSAEGSSEAMIFVHGFNTSFSEALLRAGQVFWDLQYRGLPIVFSWPSRGGVLQYEYDRNSALASRAAFIEILRKLRLAGVQRVHVLAHSMGNFVVLDALANHSHTSEPLRVQELLMAAPDVDCDHYLKIAPHVRTIVDGMTLYASSKDRALLLSKRVAGSIERAGDVPAGGPIVVAGVDTIDVTEVGAELLGLGHGSYANRRPVLNDIGLLVSKSLRPPTERLREIRGMPQGAFPAQWWRFVP